MSDKNNIKLSQLYLILLQQNTREIICLTHSNGGSCTWFSGSLVVPWVNVLKARLIKMDAIADCPHNDSE